MGNHEPISFRVRLLGSHEADSWLFARRATPLLLATLVLTATAGFATLEPSLLAVAVLLGIILLPLGEPGTLYLEPESLVFLSNYRDRRLTLPLRELAHLTRHRRMLEILRSSGERHWLLCSPLLTEDIFDQIQELRAAVVEGRPRD